MQDDRKYYREIYFLFSNVAVIMCVLLLASYFFAVLCCCSKSRASLGAYLPESSLGRDRGPSPPLTRRSRMSTRQRVSLSAAIPKLSISDEGESNETEFAGTYCSSYFFQSLLPHSCLNISLVISTLAVFHLV